MGPFLVSDDIKLLLYVRCSGIGLSSERHPKPIHIDFCTCRQSVLGDPIHFGSGRAGAQDAVFVFAATKGFSWFNMLLCIFMTVCQVLCRQSVHLHGFFESPPICTSGPGPGAYNLAAPSSGPAFSFGCVRDKHRQRKPQQMPMAKASMPVFLGRGTGYNIMRSNAGACEKGMQEPQMQDSPLPTLDVKQLCFTAVLGQGGLAKVAKVRWQQQEFALKFLKPVQTSDQQPPDQHQRDLEGLRREAIILVECRHDLVVSAVAWISGAVEGVVLELLGPSLSYAHSNLADQLTADKNKRRNEVLNTFQPYQLCWHLPWLIQNKRRNEVSNTFQPYQLCWHLPWLIQNKRRNEVLNTFQPYQLCWHLPWLIQNKRRNEVLNTFQPYQLCRQVPWLIQNKRRNEVLNTF